MQNVNQKKLLKANMLSPTITLTENRRRQCRKFKHPKILSSISYFSNIQVKYF